MARGKIVCFYGGKGGVGKTTTLLSLAGTLSKLNKKVLIVDLDLTNGAIAISLNREANKTIFNFVEDYINNKYNDLDKYITKYDEKISFVASPKDPRYASRIDVKYIDILLEKSVYNYDVVLIDTAGRLHNKVGLMNELGKVKKVMQKVLPSAPDEVLLVLDGSTGQNAYEQARQFAAATDVNALAVTKLDGTAKGGVVIGICDQMKIPVKYIGVGEGITDLQIFNPREFVRSLFLKE